MLQFWLTLAVVTGNLGNEFYLVVGETHEVGIANDVVGVQMVTGVRHDKANIGKECCCFQIQTVVRFNLE